VAQTSRTSTPSRRQLHDELFIAQELPLAVKPTRTPVDTCGEPSTWKGPRTALETNDAVAPRIRDYLARNFLFSDEGFNYGDDASFLELGIIDSFGVAELLSFVEEEFGISVADDELLPDNFDSVCKLSSFIILKQGPGT